MKLIKGEKILLLAPDKLLVSELSEKLGNVGFDVLAANDTATTLKLIEVVTASVILLDLSMKSPDGNDLLTFFKSKVKLINTPIIVLSSNSN